MDWSDSRNHTLPSKPRVISETIYLIIYSIVHGIESILYYLKSFYIWLTNRGTKVWEQESKTSALVPSM